MQIFLRRDGMSTLINRITEVMASDVWFNFDMMHVVNSEQRNKWR